MDNLVEEINNIIQINRNVRLWNMIYNLSAVHVKLLKLKETHHEKTEEKTYV